MLYLDNAATTRIDKEVLAEMLDCMEDSYGNSESKFYDVAERAKERISKSRGIIASSIGCDSEEVVFTSGATESNNLFIKGYAMAHPEKKTIIISAIEHSSIESTCAYMETLGYNVIRIPVDSTGKIKLDVLKSSINDDTLFVSIIWVNNEIGTIQDIAAIDKICSGAGVVFHSDATQAIGKVNIDLSKYDALKFLTFTAHKIYGPKGVGTLIARKENGCKLDIVPLLHGGEQEEGYRGGTLSNELIVGFGKAVEMAVGSMEASNKHLCELESALISKMQKVFGNRFFVNNGAFDKIPGLINCKIQGINNMVLLKKMAPYVAASTGSACSVSKPSRVLKAIGMSDEDISYSLRLSLSCKTDISELDIFDLL